MLIPVEKIQYVQLTRDAPNEEVYFLLQLVALGDDAFGVVRYRGAAAMDFDLKRGGSLEVAGFKKPLNQWEAIRALRDKEQQMVKRGYRKLSEDLPFSIDCQFTRGEGGLKGAAAKLARLASSERGVAAGLADFVPDYALQPVDYQSFKYPLALHLAFIGVMTVRIDDRVLDRTRILKRIDDLVGQQRWIVDLLGVYRDAHENMAARIGLPASALVL